MAITYNDLVAMVPVTLQAQNRDLPASLPFIIRQAEDEIIDRIDHDAFKAKLQSTFIVSPSTTEVDLTGEDRPVYEVRALNVGVDGTFVPMERREIERLNATFRTFDTGVPRFYAEADDPLVFRVFPTPDTEYSIRVTANVEPERLSTTIQQSLLSRIYPRMLEMAVLKHASRFMRNPVDEKRYGGEFDLALTAANAQIARRRRDETGVVTQVVANQVG